MEKKVIENFSVNIFVVFLSQLEYKAPHNFLHKYTQNQISPSWFQDQDRFCTPWASWKVFHFIAPWSLPLFALWTKPRLSSITFPAAPPVSRV